jgi:hypothetical protein
LDPGAEIQSRADRLPVEAVDDAIRRSFARLELHRQQALGLAQAKRPSNRQQGVFLLAAIDRLVRYLHVAEELTDWQAMRLWVEYVLAEDATESRPGRRRRSAFIGGGRRRARAAARERFAAIAAEVIDELEDAITEPFEPAADGQPGRCSARTRRGGRCKNPAVANGLCELHSRLAADPELARALRL